ncbi:hypothetical protein QJS04_geneDACA010413 [Acorus gramineus]|uniref:Uncharacterized protein n=1 Tax=Acorus gramineus TaxID=55184 RepID=A0AAV8ZZH1_ACOGR|nr:hypothetical protein QJS04_geneDACA010413 [Acorus gramineus]
MQLVHPNNGGDVQKTCSIWLRVQGHRVHPSRGETLRRIGEIDEKYTCNANMFYQCNAIAVFSV